jgi:hypothetical protein
MILCGIKRSKNMAIRKRESALSETALLDRHVFMKCLGYPKEAVDGEKSILLP